MARFGNLDALPYQFEPERQFDLEETESTNSSENEEDVETEDWRMESTLWCFCERCTIMPTVQECLCCREINCILTQMEDQLPGTVCVTDHIEFPYVVLRRSVLRAAG